MSDGMLKKAVLTVRRGAPGEAAQAQSWEVPFEQGQTVLDALRWIRVHADPTLAFRYSCISANACKECMMQVDGKTVYACLTRLETREMLVEPLSKKDLVRDLVTAIAPSDERL